MILHGQKKNKWNENREYQSNLFYVIDNYLKLAFICINRF